MSVPRETLLAKVREWMHFADADQRGARHLLGMADCPYFMVAYHAQQAAEKSLKAFLVFKNVDFPFTHDITALRQLCAEHGSWAMTLTQADQLTRYGTTARYPGIGVEVTRATAELLVTIAEQVVDSVQQALSEKGLGS